MTGAKSQVQGGDDDCVIFSIQAGVGNFEEDAVKLRSLVCCCLIVLVPLSAWPQSQSAPLTGAQNQDKKLLAAEHSSKVKNEVQKRGTGGTASVNVTLRDKTKVKGYISEISATSFEVTDKKSGRVTTIEYEEVDKVRKPGLSTGAKILLGVGVAVGVVVAAGLASLAASGE